MTTVNYWRKFRTQGPARNLRAQYKRRQNACATVGSRASHEYTVMSTVEPLAAKAEASPSWVDRATIIGFDIAYAAYGSFLYILLPKLPVELIIYRSVRHPSSLVHTLLQLPMESKKDASTLRLRMAGIYIRSLRAWLCGQRDRHVHEPSHLRGQS